MKKYVLSLGLVLGASACADGDPMSASSGAPRSPADQTLQTVSQAVSASLADPAVRTDLRDDMRASLLVEHRLAFGSYLRSSSGAPLLAGMARAMNTDAAGVLRAVGELPELDFYVATQDDRRAWRATGNVAVAAALRLAKDGTMAAVTPAGREMNVAFGQPQSGVVVFNLVPAGERFRRVDPQPALAGAVIEDANDGTFGGRFTWTPTGGRAVSMELADMHGVARNGTRFAMAPSCDPSTAIVECDGGGGGGGGGYTAPADTTRLDHYYIHYADGCGSPDPSFIAKHYTASGTMTGEGKLEYSGIPRHDPMYPRAPLVFRRIRQGTGEYINLRIVDRDSWFCGGDDDKGNRNYVASENGVIATIYKGSNPTMNAQLGWTVKY